MTITEQAPAKVNLTLDILGKRPDGYHDLKMVMQTVSLYDTVTVTETAGESVSVSVDRGDLPAGPDNIAWKAADVFFRRTGLPRRGLAIALQKRIPAQAGMAGGSADGAAVLRVLRRLYAPDLPMAELEDMAAAVGSDVPFCVRGGTVLAEGRGERLQDLPPMPACWLALCKPAFGLSTPALFGRVRTAELKRRPDHGAMEQALRAGELTAVARQLANVFEEVLTAEEAREIRAIQETLLSRGALGAVMTGSGPTVFGLFSEQTQAEEAAAALRRPDRQVFTAQPV
ncbi:4-(cytidine 5'-diphospho)-2-C-methyl-D-erythritol kinase [Dysosmobacter sp.]|uniref:4-(cytidine 5'-diphospho)-2-C-methyl-D-erythritol kinase n=1 Tax=Dysosmobacter sp. TaxID=2591382 RepID=UPI002A88C4EF|nr:4-(cytidine 5'-diphospho)-2-C-methyl-D-erythritol kinase [Dysosmobacter sp.]MDY3282571.1 4-(cytidine 5'-diphospho)-2-C-methyl-D-erythritol kinase [Dysosmobacter sp.]